MRIAHRGWQPRAGAQKYSQIRLSSPEAVTAANAKERRHQAVEHNAEERIPASDIATA
jgi:hypothetical protein